MPILRCEKLVKSFQGVRALDALDIQFTECGITAIIGPNGAGKSTLLNVLTGFLRPDTGRCFFDCQETTHLSPYQIARLGIARTFQEVRLIRQMSVLDNVMLACRFQRGEELVYSILRTGVAREEQKNRGEALDFLRHVGVEGREGDIAGTLSYGQQKLVAIACCLAMNAKILLLDEPVAGVHPQTALHILKLLRHLCDDGKQIIFIEHDIAAVRQISDTVVVLDEGSVVAQGPTHDVLARSEITEAYLA